MKDDKIESQIRKTMEQFDQAEQLAPNPFFYTRVEARLIETQQQQRNLVGVLKPALLLVLLLVNVSTAVWYFQPVENKDSSEDLMEILAGDLNVRNEQSDLINLE